MNKYLVIAAAILHLLPHPFGVSPVGASAIYAGGYAPRYTAWIVPVAILLLGNLIGGFYDPVIMLFVYGGFVAAAVVARWLLAASKSAGRVAAAVLAGAVCFFLLSNFAIWLVGMYPPTAAGLIDCYVRGLPFLGTALLVDGVYVALLFGIHNLLAEQSEPVPQNS